jgi:hypothetical protein
MTIVLTVSWCVDVLVRWCVDVLMIVLMIVLMTVLMCNYRVLQKSDSVWKTGLSLQTYAKPAENLVFERKTYQNELKTLFLLDLVYEGLDKICKPDLKRPKTWDKPIVNLPENHVLLSFVSSRADKPGLWNLSKVDKPGL